MQEKAKAVLDKVKNWWKAAAKKTKMLLGAGVLSVLVVLVIAAVISMNRPYTVLFTDLNQSELTEIVSYLSDNGVTDYRISEQNTILVPQNQEAQLKADLIMQGYPTSGFAHSTYFENVGSLTTESERNTLILYDLADSIEAVIRCLDGVSDAAVEITPQEDNSYVLDKSNIVEAKASVMVVLENGRKLSNNQVSAIRNFVSHSVKGLEIDNVSIIDSMGNSYSAGGSFSETQDVSALKLQLEEQVNNTIRTNILQVLTPIYGEQNISVSVNSIVDVDRRVTESTDYTAENQETGEGIIGKQIYDREIVRGDDGTVGGVAGTESNADLNTYVENEMQANGNESVISSSGEDDYLVDQEKSQVEHLAGTVSDVMVSVSINATQAGNVDVASLYPHIGRAAGISTDMQTDKISILVQPFFQEESAPLIVPDTLPEWVIYGGAAGILLFLIVLTIILLVVRSRRRRAAADNLGQQPIDTQTKKDFDIMDLQTEKSLQLRWEVRDFAEKNPEIAAQMVKSWLKEGDGKNE